MGSVLYGELAIIGFNGVSKNREPRRRSKITLYKLPVSNGVCPGPINRVLNPYDSCAVRNSATHSVSYTVSRHETVVVEYLPDPTTDMFQIGRSMNNHIDFVVSEPHPVRARWVRPQSPHSSKSPCSAVSNQSSAAHEVVCPPVPRSHPESAVSRFACRISVKRDPPHTARIYAAGFDASKNIVLGELAIKWNSHGQMDGLTTNGVMILRTDDDHAAETADTPLRLSRWREVSICGSVYQMREKRSIPTKENRVPEDNVLRDKTLIDLCGVTLFWRSGTGLSKTANPSDLKSMIDSLNCARFQCPVMYRTLRLPYPDTVPVPANSGPANGTTTPFGSSETKSEPYVYLSCGHVYGWHTWLAKDDQSSSNRTCPLCMQPSSYVPLRMGLESAFYVDRALPTHCFNPCGHMASEKTAQYWCSTPLPNTVNFEFHPRCPFCLVYIEPKPVQLRFSGETDADLLMQLLNASLSADTCLEADSAHSSNDDHLVSAQ